MGIGLDPTVAAHVQTLLWGTNNGDCDIGDDVFDPINMHTLDLADVICGAENLLSDSIRREGIAD